MIQKAILDVVFQIVSDTKAQSYVNLATLSLFVYDTILTTHVEIEYIWSRRNRVVSILYIILRCSVLLSIIFAILVHADTGETNLTCDSFLHLTGAFTSIGQMASGGILLLRCYAIAPSDKIICVVMALIPLTNAVISTLINSLSTCRLTPPITIKLNTVTSALTLILGVCIVLLTFKHMISIWEFERLFKALERRSLTSLMIYQGVVLNSIILIWNVANVISNHFIREKLINITTPLENAVATIFLCRFILNIRQFNTNYISSLGMDSHRFTLSPIRVAEHSFQAAILEDIGDPDNMIALSQLHETSSTSSSLKDITLQEFPWATGILPMGNEV